MKKIIFERRPKVYLPEISAYIDYIDNHVEGWEGYDSLDIPNYNPNDFDVVWHFMGFDTSGKGKTVIHEYNSLSTGFLATVKNDIKKIFNAKPTARVFLNRAVKSHFSFNDNLPYKMRDMGIDKKFFVKNDKLKIKYDFVYAGSLTDRGNTVTQALEQFRTVLTNATLLVIGEAPSDIVARFGNCKNITFVGRVPYTKVAELAQTAKYGLNLMPDIYPLNAQTATKILEYCALGLKVVSSDYKWVRRFERKRHGKFFFFDKSFSNLTMDNIEKFEFSTPDVKDLEWKSLIQSSSIFNILEEL